MNKCTTCGATPTQTPYYENVGNETIQDHASIFNNTRYAAGVTVKEEFQIPAIGADIQVYLKDVTNIVVGSYLWHPAYGSLKIIHWDECTRKVGLLNEGLNGTAPAGTTVSECTSFIPSSRPCCEDQDNFSFFPFLAEDFTVPSVTQQRTVQVTSTFGLVAGTDVRIGSNVYHLDQINSSLQIVIRNEGSGGVPGSTVSALDAEGKLQYLLTTVVSSACTAPKVDQGVLIICDGSNESILDGEFAGQVPVLQDATTDEVKFEFLDTLVRVCTVLTAQMSITAAQPSYTIDVDDESIFTIGDVLEINVLSLRWLVTDNTTPGELDVICTIGNPLININVSSGSSVCRQLTDEYLLGQVLGLVVPIMERTAASGIIVNGTAIGALLASSSVSIGMLMPKSGVLTDFTIHNVQPITGGTLFIKVNVINGGGTTSTAVLSLTSGQRALSALGSPIPFLAGDWVTLDWQTVSAVFTTGGTGGTIVNALGKFDA